jgi:hypothetical protein
MTRYHRRKEVSHRPERRRADCDWSIENIELIEAELTATAASTHRLKRFDRAAKEQFEQHRLWLEHYLAAEALNRKEHERRLRQTRQRRKRRAKREAVRRRLEQGALAILLFLRSCGLSLFDTYAYAPARWLTRVIRIGLFWSRRRVRAFALSLAKVVSILFSAMRREGYAVTLSTAELVSQGLSGGRVKARATAVALLNWASNSYLWIVAKIRRSAPLLSELAGRYQFGGFAFAGRLAQRTRVSVKYHRQTQDRKDKLTRLLLQPSIPYPGSSEKAGGLISNPAAIFDQSPVSICPQVPRMVAPLVGRTFKGASSWRYLALWMFLVGCSSYYLFVSPSSNPEAFDKPPVRSGAPDIHVASRLSTGQAAENIKSSNQSHHEASEIQASLRELSRQLARVDTRLKPIEESVAVATSGRTRGQKFSDSPAERFESTKSSNGFSRDRAALPVSGPHLAEEPPKTIAESAGDRVDTREDFTFCRKWVGLGTIVCRKEDGTAFVSSADRTTLIDENASDDAPSGPIPTGNAKAAVPSLAKIPEERVGEVATAKIRYGIELGRAHQPGELMQLWRQFLTSHVALAIGLEPKQVLTREQDWRLIAGPFNTIVEARAACASLHKASKPCTVSLYAGDPPGLGAPNWTGVSN